MMKVKSILSHTSWWAVNKLFAQKYGLEAAVLIGDLSTKQEYFSERGMLDEDGFFFNEQSRIEEDTTLSKHKQVLAIDILRALGVILVIRKGVPPKNYYKVHLSALNEIIVNLHNE